MFKLSSAPGRGRLRAPAVPLGIALAMLPVSAVDAGVQDQIFASSFSEVIDALYPQVGGQWVLPDYPLTDRLDWIIDELAAGESTTVTEVQARFTSAHDSAGMANFFNDILRPSFPNAAIIDVISITPTRGTVVIEGDTAGAPLGFVNVWSQYSGSELITSFSVANFAGSVQFPADQSRSLTEAADHFQTLGTANSLLVGTVGPQGQCHSLVERNAQVPRALGSIFKMWVLAALAQRLDDGLSSASDPITLVSAERAAAGIINNEALGTIFSVQDMATLMMANSDNTSTDHLHELVGRTAVADRLDALGIADPDLLLPFLNISEQFHVFTRFNLATAQSYVDGSLAFRQQFLANEIVPEGPSHPIDFPFFHTSLLTSGTWRASALDVCRTLAGLHGLDRSLPGFELVDLAMGSQAAQPGVRNHWQRVWYKGGSLESGASGMHVLTHAWLLQKDGASRPYVVVALGNSDGGGIDQFAVQSITSRMLELVSDMAD